MMDGISILEVNMNEIIRTHKLTKQYGQEHALVDVDLVIKKGDIFGLVGNNGAGKTTLLRMLTGQSKVTSGSIELFSASSDDSLNQVRKRIGALVEAPAFYPKMTVAQNLEYYRIQRGIPDKSRIDKALEDVNLAYAKKKKFSTLSLGMKQRLALALALMGEPELLLLDEPINGLDPSGILEFRNLLVKLNKEKHMTILISSHLLSELSNIATCYGFINHGRLVEQISAEALKEKCAGYLEVKVNNAYRLTALMEERLNYKQYKVLPSNIIHIYDAHRLPEKISELASVSNIALLGLNEKSVELEEYYMELIGGHASA